jgi:DNA-binding CsgD family transcriptional regulator
MADRRRAGIKVKNGARHMSRKTPPAARVTRQGRRRSAAAGGPPILTLREIDVLSLLARDFPYAGIAIQLGISLNTVTSHIKNSYRKLAVHSGAAAVTRAAELGLLRRDGSRGPGRSERH